NPPLRKGIKESVPGSDRARYGTMLDHMLNLVSEEASEAASGDLKIGDFFNSSIDLFRSVMMDVLHETAGAPPLVRAAFERGNRIVAVLRSTEHLRAKESESAIVDVMNQMPDGSATALGHLGCSRHAVDIVIHKTEGQFQVTVCNRGLRPNPYKQFETYSVPETKLPRLILNLYEHKNREGMEGFYKQMAQAGRSITRLSVYPEIHDQKAHNCSWASFAASAKLLFHLHDRQTPGSTTVRTIYKSLKSGMIRVAMENLPPENRSEFQEKFEEFRQVKQIRLDYTQQVSILSRSLEDIASRDGATDIERYEAAFVAIFLVCDRFIAIGANPRMNPIETRNLADKLLHAIQDSPTTSSKGSYVGIK
ncbi:hypothetical protein EBR96_01775, partial [bacterium]|nr:hypothetical protein [bacterium]